jgi:GNAT superfamily N-acetyltransferase
VGVRERYVAPGRYVLQCRENGLPVGYVLHGVVCSGRLVAISQACIERDRRLRGYGEEAVREVVRRAESGGATGVRLRCCDDMAAVEFWRNLGFRPVSVSFGGRGRGRMILEFVKILGQ